MIVKKAQLDKALKAPAATRCFLFYGADEAGSRALAARLEAAVGAGAERVTLSSSELKADPARLADEAASLSMFGDARVVLVDPATDDAAQAIEALIAAGAAGNAVALVAGDLKKNSKLLKIAQASADMVACESKQPSAADAQTIVVELARERGLSVSPDVARLVVDTVGSDRAIIAQEVEKFALYVGSSGSVLDQEVVAAVGAAREEGDTSALMRHVFGGNPRAVERELARLRSEGVEGITLIRAALRRALMMAGPSWQAEDWSPPRLSRAVERLSEAEQSVKASGGIGPLAADVELVEIARQAGRHRA